MNISANMLFIAMGIIVGIQLGFIIFQYERIIKLKFFMGMNVGKTKNQKDLLDRVNKKY